MVFSHRIIHQCTLKVQCRRTHYILEYQLEMKMIVMYRHPTVTFPDYRRRLGSVTLTGQGLGLGTSLFPVSAMEIKGTVR